MTPQGIRRIIIMRAAVAAALISTAALSAQPARAAEHSLAGVKIFSTAQALLMKYGTPTTIVLGTSSGNGNGAQQTPFGAGPQTQPFGGGAGGQLPPFAMGGAMGPFGAGGPGAGPFGPGGPGGAGGPFGMGGPSGRFGPGGMQNNSNGPIGGPNSIVTEQPGEVTWIYDRPSGVELQFTLDASGRVIQIRATGAHDGVKTAKGVALGDSFSTIIKKYGWPESQEQQGGVLTTLYTERSHAAFQFYDNKLVGVIVAAVE